MDGIIEVKVNGHSISKDNTCAGAQFEENSTKLRISFGDNWSGYAKTITFWNALGENSVKRTLTVDLLEDVAKSTSVYLVPIPGEAMTEEGRLTFVIDGYIDGVRRRTVKDALAVLPSEKADDADDPRDPTPTQAEQLQAQMESVIGDLQSAEIAMQEINKSIPVVEQYAKETEAYAEEAESSAREAKDSADGAKVFAESAEKSAGKASYIGEDNYWYAWDSTLGEFVNTGVLAEGKTSIYVGETKPTDTDIKVWIDTDGRADFEDGVFIPDIDIGSIATVVSSRDDLASIIPEKDQLYIIKYESLPYCNADGERLETTNPVYITKIGDGIHNLTELPTTQNLIPGNEGEGSVVQFLESELYEVTDEGTTPRSTATGKGAVSFGRYNRVLAREGAAFNYSNTVLARNAFAANSSNTIEAAATSSFVAGHRNIAKAPYQTVFGLYADIDEYDRFAVGNGGGEDKRNSAFRVKHNGDAVVERHMTLGGTLKSPKAEFSDSIKVSNSILLGDSTLDEKDIKKIEQISYNSKFSENNLSQVIGTIRAGIVPEDWLIGDEMGIEVGGVTRTIVIIGKNTDTFADGTIAPFTFQFKDLYDDWKAPMYMQGVEDAGWENSTMRNETLVSLMDTIPSVLKNSIEAVIKYTPDREGKIQTTQDKLFLLAFPEMLTREEDDPDYCAEIPEALYGEYYGPQANRIKYADGVAQGYFLRQPTAVASYRNINAEGARNGFNAYSSQYFSPAFCITNKPALRVGDTFINEEQLKKLLDVIS